MKPDEAALLAAVLVTDRAPDRPFADAIGDRLGIHPKRTDYLLCKWTDRGWWEYGVSARSGWLTDAGLAVAQNLRNTV